MTMRWPIQLTPRSLRRLHTRRETHGAPRLGLRLTMSATPIGPPRGAYADRSILCPTAPLETHHGRATRGRAALAQPAPRPRAKGIRVRFATPNSRIAPDFSSVAELPPARASLHFWNRVAEACLREARGLPVLEPRRKTKRDAHQVGLSPAASQERASMRRYTGD